MRSEVAWRYHSVSWSCKKPHHRWWGESWSASFAIAGFTYIWNKSSMPICNGLSIHLACLVAKSIMKMHIANSYGLGGPGWKLLALSLSYLTVRICLAKKREKILVSLFNLFGSPNKFPTCRFKYRFCITMLIFPKIGR